MAQIGTFTGKTALHLAAHAGNEELTRLLLKNRADVTAKSSGGETALHLAAGIGNEVLSRLLLECGAHVTAKTWDGETALHRAADKGAVTQLLLERHLKSG